MSQSQQGSRIAGGNTAYGRVQSDYYPTPPEATHALLDLLNFRESMTIWEPACGDGHMTKALQSKGHSVISSDIRDTGYVQADYLTTPLPDNVQWIITNPPFKLAAQFIERSHEHCIPFALLLKSQYWHAKSRYELFTRVPPSIIAPLTWRPDFLFKQRGNGSPLMDCMWCIWMPFWCGNSWCGNTIYKPILRPKEAPPSGEDGGKT